MLKGFVSGEEKDIVRIPMKTRNLFEGAFGGSIGTTGGIVYSEQYEVYYARVTAGATYTISGGYYVYAYYSNPPSVGTINSVDNERHFTSQGNTITPIEGTIWIGVRVNTGDKPMLNLGSSSLPYEPYGYQEGWEVRDNQDRILWGREDELQTATGTLPFKGYSLPLKVKSILGNAVQNGTPSPDNIITPEMCGVLNESLAIIESDSYSLNDWYYEDTRLTDLLAPGTYTISFVTDSITAGTTTDGTIGIGTTSDYTEDLEWFTRAAAGSMTTVTVTLSESKCLWARFVRDHNIVKITCSISVSKIRVEEGSRAYGWKVPFENHGENLFDASSLVNDMHLDNTTGLPITYTGRIASPDPVDVSHYSTVTISYETAATTTNAMYSIFSNNVLVGRFTAVSSGTVIDVSNADKMYICFYSTWGGNVDTSSVSNIMLNLGSTPKPYSPYLNETLPVYLGEVPTVRRVKKLVLDGTEEWSYDAQYTRFITEKSDFVTLGLRITPFMSNSFTSVDDGRPISSVPDNSVYSGAGDYPHTIYIKCSEFASVEAWKSWLAEKYANGTPVIIWYILRNEQTGIVNEPLCKISTYADELTTIQVHGLSAPLYGIGDYKDTLNLSTSVVTRKVKRLVLTGAERWQAGSENFYCFIDSYGDGVPYSRLLCTHSQNSTINNTGKALFMRISDFSPISTVNDFKSFLAAQYQNGTPVTIWYVLAESTTETVTVPTGMTGEIEGYLTQVSTPTPTNRSVPKWNGVEETGGTYAVTVYTPPEIPTTTGQNTLTVETEKIHGLTNPLCGIGDYKDVLNLSTGVITRKIKKLVLTGAEEWTFSSLTNIWIGSTGAKYSATAVGIICSHFKPMYAGNTDGTCRFENYGRIAFRYEAVSNIDEWKAYLAAQYANGTPVIIWYVLNTPETETITVPYGLECSVEGYLTQSDTPTPSSPITPDSNGILESGGTYAVEVSLVPSNLTVKGHIKELT